jgi:hypothetical protein
MQAACANGHVVPAQVIVFKLVDQTPRESSLTAVHTAKAGMQRRD